jgi:hypothetical protein
VFAELLQEYACPITSADLKVCAPLKLPTGVTRNHPAHWLHRLANLILYRRPTDYFQVTPAENTANIQMKIPHRSHLFIHSMLFY